MIAILVIFPDKILFVISNSFKVLPAFLGCACSQPLYQELTRASKGKSQKQTQATNQ